MKKRVLAVLLSALISVQGFVPVTAELQAAEDLGFEEMVDDYEAEELTEDAVAEEVLISEEGFPDPVSLYRQLCLRYGTHSFSLLYHRLVSEKRRDSQLEAMTSTKPITLWKMPTAVE